MDASRDIFYSRSNIFGWILAILSIFLAILTTLFAFGDVETPKITYLLIWSFAVFFSYFLTLPITEVRIGTDGLATVIERWLVGKRLQTFPLRELPLPRLRERNGAEDKYYQVTLVTPAGREIVAAQRQDYPQALAEWERLRDVIEDAKPRADLAT